MIRDIQLRVLPQLAVSDQSIRSSVAEEAALEPRRIQGLRVLKRSIDARQRQIFVNLTVRVWIDEPVSEEAFTTIDYPNVEGRPQVIVVGAGPGGLFAALRLIELGLRPVVIERGKDVHARKRDIARIAREHLVDPESNYSFGEGGAGAYSDGKLYTRSKKRGSVEKILNVFCQHGAQTTILSDAHPHIGTDRLPRVIENMRSTILRCGGEVYFQTRMTDLIIEGDRVVGIVANENVIENDNENSVQAVRVPVGVRVKEFRGPVILATGHSARDVYRMLAARNIDIEAKGIAVGVRLEHPSQLIDQIQYHNRQGRGRYLPAAEYSFVQQCQGRGVYSFCMCPGGFVVPAATGPEQVVVNGMSPSHRNGRWSNSGMVVEIRPEDVGALTATFPDDDTAAPESEVLAMLRFQERLERLCWQQGGRRQTAPAQRMADFVNARLSYDLPESSYAPGLISSPLHFWMPPFITMRLQEGFRAFGRKSHGFLTNEATVIGVETRTSSPVRILRDGDTLHHVRLRGLYPCGEGAGYAGGIVSAAIDGERCAEACAGEFSAI
ncbi:MAG: FAD-dependent monooxygenase [Bacteroidaceae bacterium]|nr:FAD-dependent monooxygenase [Bacteroidaceae bacterium]